MTGLLRRKTCCGNGGFRFGWIVVGGAGFQLATAQGHAPWLSVGGERHGGSLTGQGQILILHENGWHWLDPSNIQDRSASAARQELVGPKQTSEGPLRAVDAQVAEVVKPLGSAPTASWFGATIVGTGLIASFGGLYWLLKEAERENETGTADQLADPSSPMDEGEADITTPTVAVMRTVTVIENHQGQVVTASATGFDANTLEYSLSGADQVYFRIDPQSGVVESQTEWLLDFEQAHDQDANNRYDITVQANDGAGNTAIGLVTVLVDDVDDEAPTITAASSNYSWPESQTGQIATFVVTDADSDPSTLTLTLVGQDASSFRVHQNGVLSVEAALDYENPSDENSDGLFEFALRAEDQAGNISADVPISIRLTDQWEPALKTTVKLTDVLAQAQELLMNSVVDDVEYASIFPTLDFDTDGDLDAIFVAIDNNGTAGEASIVIAAFDDPSLQTLDQSLWTEGVNLEVPGNLGGIDHITAARVPDPTADFVFTLLGDNGHVVVTAKPFLGGYNIQFNASSVVAPYRLYSDENGDGGYEHFWEFSANGTYRFSGDDDDHTTELVSSALRATDQLLFAVGDINGDQDHDVVTFNTETAEFETWFMDDYNNQLIKASDLENPYQRAALPDTFPDPTTIQQIGVEAVTSNAQDGYIPNLNFTTAETFFVLGV